MALNTVESIEAFSSEILQGHWDNVLRIVSQLKIPEKKLMDLYEQVTVSHSVLFQALPRPNRIRLVLTVACFVVYCNMVAPTHRS